MSLEHHIVSENKEMLKKKTHNEWEGRERGVCQRDRRQLRELPIVSAETISVKQSSFGL